MPPSLSTLHSIFVANAHPAEVHPAFEAAKSQWQNPKDILTVLLIIGGDIVHLALAQLVCCEGFPYITPVAFSFGWVSYAFSSVVAVAGSDSLMPPPDGTVSCINVKTGYGRSSRSWALSRLFRDLLPESRPWKDSGPRPFVALFYDTVRSPKTGYRHRDWVYYFGLTVIVIQLGIACIPGALNGNWVILISTFGGTVLAQLTAALPQWYRDIWAARDVDSEHAEIVVLTAGNGNQEIIIVKSDGCGKRLEDLATGRNPPSRMTTAAIIVIACLWIVHLMSVQSIEQDAWYLLAIGALGMVQNAVSAGMRRDPSALGFHLKKRESDVVTDGGVFKGLQEIEDRERGAGLSLLPVFFPGRLRSREEIWMKQKLAQYEEEKKNKQDEEKKGSVHVRETTLVESEARGETKTNADAEVITRRKLQ